MREFLKTYMQKYPGVFNPMWERIYPLIRHGGGEISSDFEDNSEAFSKIYSENRWGDTESASGWGSTLSYTKVVRRHLERLLTDLKIQTFLDAPCGDFNWMQHVRLPPETSYVGGDIVPELIAGLSQRYGDPRHKFLVIDIVKGPIAPADIWLCRDVLFHLTNADATTVLRNFANSGIPFILTTTYDFVKDNADARPGGFRYINLALPPFGLGKPRIKIPDFLAPAPPRYLALWSREEVRAALKTCRSPSGGASTSC
jgi:hypothetical protein